VRRVTFKRRRMHARRDLRRPFRVALRGRGARTRATAVLRDGRTVNLRARVPRRCR